MAVACVVCLGVICGTARAEASASGGALAGTPISSYAVTPVKAVQGAALTFSFTTQGSTRTHVRARVDLLGGDGSVVRAKLGVVRAGRRVTIKWTPPKRRPPEVGSYTARLVITRPRTQTAYARVPLTVVSPTPPVPATVKEAPAGAVLPGGVFPLQGPYDFGDAAMRFGAPRSGHTHQGQDIAAAEGTPIVAPRAGTITTVDYQAGGAGYYVVMRSVAGPDYVFMHLMQGSTLVAEGQAVAQGQQLAQVGDTGESEGPHLHFEDWPNGWWADGSQPIDPLPQLQAWAAGS